MFMPSGRMEYLTFLAFMAVLLSTSWTIDRDCNYLSDVEAGRIYYVYNTEYPKYNTRTRSCRWYAKSAWKLKLSCDVTLPATAQCAGDRISVSPTGDYELADAQNYCGNGTFEITSVTDSMNIVFTGFNGTAGSRFSCELTAVKPIKPTNPISNCDCGWSNPALISTRIAGGMETAPNEYPMMAGLVNLQLRLLYCGGTIISTKHVLTAAHCRPVFVSIKEIAVLVGDHDISTGEDTDAASLHYVSEFLVHPRYDNYTQVNDIAVITVVDTIIFTMAVGPACLPFRRANALFNGTKVEALGWGTTEFAGPKSDVLQKVELDVTAITKCQNIFPNVTKKQICTYTPGKDTCSFDSGGPLLWQNPSTKRLVSAGLVSYGEVCADTTPGVNTRIGAYLKWIVSVTPGARYCNLE